MSGRQTTCAPSVLPSRAVAPADDLHSIRRHHVPPAEIGSAVASVPPRLAALDACFAALAETLDTGDMFAASWNLELVAQDIRAIGAELADEGKCLQNLIALNFTLSHRIDYVADDVRLLVAMVSNAKVEMASIEAPGESLDGFGQTLEALATKAKVTLQDYQTRHTSLLGILRKTADSHGSFERTHQGKLATVSLDIDASVATFRARHKIMAQAAAAIAKNAGAIGVQIAAVVASLHDSAAVPQQADMASGFGHAQAKVRDLATPRKPLAGSHGEGPASFLSDLQPKLKTAEILIQECRHARSAADGTATSIMASFEELETLASQVAAMVIDMTIIGTNAIVKAYRLGQRGAGLSIIAQQLRSQALKVAEGITLLTPAMTNARAAATQFTATLESLDSTRMAALAGRTADVVSSFDRVGRQTVQAMRQLEGETLAIADILNRAAAHGA